MTAHDRPSRPAATRVEIAIGVVENDGLFLIGLRPEGEPLAGYWEFPGGKLAPGETAAEAAVRECLEEAGLVARVTGPYPSVAHDYAHGEVLLHFFACVPVEQRGKLPARFRWVRRDELSRYEFPPANATLVAAITGAAVHGQRSCDS